MNKHVVLPRWFIVKTRPSQEVQAGEQILGLGMTVYCPRFRKEFRHARTKGWMGNYYALLPGYVFVLASPQWGRVLGCESVTGVLRSSDRGEAVDPIPIADSDVRAIRTRQEAGDFDHLRVNENTVRIGDMVRIGEGHFAGQRGPVEAVNDDNIIMLLPAFGGAAKTTVPVANLLKVG